MKTLAEYLNNCRIDEETSKPEFVSGAKPKQGSVLSFLKPKDAKGMREKVAVWYKKACPDDPCGKKINYHLNFADLAIGLDLTIDPYDMLEVGDSVVREKVFTELAKRLGCKYNDVYDKWLTPKFVKGVFANPANELRKMQNRCSPGLRPQKRLD